MLPDEETLSQRRQAGQGLFRPEVAVLLAYAKMTLYDELLASDLPDDPYLLQDLIKYFPRPLRKRFAEQIAQHRLRREITATLVANSLVNRGLGEFVGELVDQTGRSAASVARAYVDRPRRLRAGAAVRRSSSRSPTAVGANYQITLLGAARQAIMRGTEWFLRNAPSPIDIRTTVERFTPGIASLLENLELVLPEASCARFAQAAEQHRERGIEAGLARRLAGLPYLFPACEVIAVADQVGTAVVTAGGTYFALDAQLHLGRLRGAARARRRRATIGSGWRSPGSTRTSPRSIAGSRSRRSPAPRSSPTSTTAARRCRARSLSWLTNDVAGFARWQRLLSELDSQSSTDLAMLAVAVRALGTLDAVHDEAA